MKRSRNAGRMLRGLLAATAAVTVTLAATNVSHAATGLADNTPQTVTQRRLSTTLTTHYVYWSVVAAVPRAGASIAMRLTDGSGRATTSAHSGGVPEWFAVDSNIGRQPFGTYTLDVARRTAGAGGYDLEYAQTRLLDLGAERSSYPLAVGEVALVRDIWLVPDDALWILYDPSVVDVYVVSSSTADPSSWVQTVDTANRQSARTVVNSSQACLSYRATATAWHGLVVIHKVPSTASSVTVFPITAAQRATGVPNVLPTGCAA